MNFDRITSEELMRAFAVLQRARRDRDYPGGSIVMLHDYMRTLLFGAIGSHGRNRFRWWCKDAEDSYL